MCLLTWVYKLHSMVISPTTGNLGSILGTDQTLDAYRYLTDGNGWRFIVESNCNAVLYDPSNLLRWASNTAFQAVNCVMRMQTDCELRLSGRSIVDGKTSMTLWASNILNPSDNGCQLVLNSTGSLAIVGSTGILTTLLFDARE